MIDDIEVTVIRRRDGARRTVRISSLAVVIVLLLGGVALAAGLAAGLDVYREYGARRLLIALGAGASLGLFIVWIFWRVFRWL